MWQSSSSFQAKKINDFPYLNSVELQRFIEVQSIASLLVWVA